MARMEGSHGAATDGLADLRIHYPSGPLKRWMATKFVAKSYHQYNHNELMNNRWLTHTWFYMHVIFIQQHTCLCTRTCEHMTVHAFVRYKRAWCVNHVTEKGCTNFQITKQFGVSSLLRLRGPDWNFGFLLFKAVSSWPWGWYKVVVDDCVPMINFSLMFDVPTSGLLRWYSTS